MAVTLVRVVLLAGGLGIGEIGLTSFAGGLDIAVVQLLASLALLVAGTAGFMVPLLASRTRKELEHG